MYEYFRIYYCKIVSRLPKDFIRRFLSFFACAVISLSLLIQTPLKRSAVGVGDPYDYVIPSCSTIPTLELFFSNNQSVVTSPVSALSAGSSFSFKPEPSYSFTSGNTTTTYFNASRIYCTGTLSFAYPYDLNPQQDFSQSLFLQFSASGLGTGTYSYEINFYNSQGVNFYTVYYSGISYNSSVNYQMDTGWLIYNKSMTLPGSNIPQSSIGFITYNFQFTSSGVNDFINLRSFSFSVSSLYRYLPRPVSTESVVTIPGTPATDATVSQFESLNDDLMSDFDEYQSIEDSYNDSFKSAERAVSGQFSNWSWGRLTQGTTFLSTQLQNFYNYSGDFKQLIVYPLLAGVALVFLGRWASVRSSKRSRDARRSERNNRSGGS